MENGLLAKPILFENSPGYVVSGYMVEQYHEGKKIVEQFIPKESYDDFCKTINTIPTMERRETCNT